MIHSDSYLTQLLQEAEKFISAKIPCIFNRFSLAVTSGISTYTLSDSVIRILQITWKGDRLESKSFADFGNDFWLKPQNLGVRGKPAFWLRSGIEEGITKIMLYPIPDETILADDSSLDDDTGILNRVIVSCYKIADPTAESIRLPTYLRRNIMKYWAMNKAYLREGPGQNIVAAGYFEEKFNNFLQSYHGVINTIPQSVNLKLGESRRNVFAGRPPRPVLPSSGKWSF